MNQRTIMPIVVTAFVLISGIFFCYSLVSLGPDVSSPENIVINVNKGSKITGNIDDVVNSVLQGSEEEQSVLGTGDEEGVLVTSDRKEINDFGQSADNYEF